MKKLITSNMAHLLCGNALNQGVQLFEDAMLLLIHKRHSSAYAIGVLSMEELGKFLFWDRIYFYSFDDKDYLEFNGKDSEQMRNI